MRYSAIVIVIGVALAVLVSGNARVGINIDQAAYIHENGQEAVFVAEQISDTFNEVYRATRTIARLPGVRALDLNNSTSAMDRDGLSLDTNTQITIQEIYNTLASDVSISELYIVPKSIDPDATDPDGNAPTEPFVTFDKLIVGQHAGASDEHEHEEHEEIEEIEIHEYRIMRNQLDQMMKICPTSEHIDGLDYPVLSSTPVVTCDNSRFDPSNPNDDRRRGFIISVPTFDIEGNLNGSISAVMLTDALSDLLPTGDYTIINEAMKFVITPQTMGQWEESKEHTAKARPDPALIFSDTYPISTAETGSKWVLWAGRSDTQFWDRSDTQATLQIKRVGYLSVFLVTLFAIMTLSLVHRANKRLANTNAGLETAIMERTADLSKSRDEARQALEREHEMFAELMYQKKALDEHAIVSMTDVKGKIIYVNDKFCEMSGYERDELIGHKHSILKSGEHSKEFYGELWKTIARGKVWKGEVKNRKKDGQTYWVNATIVPFRDSTGKIQKYVAIRADITLRKEHENKLNDNNLMLSKALKRETDTLVKLESTLNELEVLASTDKLTGLPNRSVFQDRLNQQIKQAQRNDSKFAVLFFDFDRFKVINDSLGHDVGDALLCSIADIFREKLRNEDTVARFGGDEFVVLLTNIQKWEDAVIKSNELLEAFAQPHRLGDHLVVSTASIGLITNQHKLQSSAEMIRDADAAMYHAKMEGKNRVVVFDEKMHANAMDRLILESDLRVALENEQFSLLYQPIVELVDGRLKGFEALVRWEHPQRGIIAPSVFIPIAEDSGLINEIGRWILWTAAEQLQQWNKMYGSEHKITVNVNISKRQLLDPSFLDNLIECKEEFNIHDAVLPLEVTESVIVDERANVVPLLHKIRACGFPIVMDDFGTGVSSLSTLHAFPIDVLKIDQSFINVLNGDRSLLAVVSSITSLADNLGIKTVAEGIESEDVVGALQSIGCTWGQGYLFAKPLNRHEAEDFILTHHQHLRNAA